MNFEDLQVGDKVIVQGGGYQNYQAVSKIDRLTKTQIVLKDGSKYGRKHGHRVGTSDWRSPHLIMYTEERAAEIRRVKLVGAILDKVNKKNLSSMDIGQLSKIWETL